MAVGCQTASLQDIAPSAADVSGVDAGTSGTETAPQATGSDAGETQASTDTVATPTIIRRNPGITSPIPIEKTAPVVNKAFVAEGASRTGEYPKLGRQPTAANVQFSEAEKVAAEAEMTELLRNRAATPDARAQYEARLRELRALAASHASDTQQEIEN